MEPDQEDNEHIQIPQIHLFQDIFRHSFTTNNNNMPIFTQMVILGIMKSHPVLQQQNLQVSFNCLTPNIKDLVIGKKKRGGIKISPKTHIAQIGSYKIKSPIHGTIIELNQNLIEKVQLLKKSAQTKGYLGIGVQNKNERKHR